MSGFLDTSVVVRYLTGDPPEQAEQAGLIVDGEEGLMITDVALLETAYVLTKLYRVPRDVVVDHLLALVQKKNISTYALDKGLVLQALLMCRLSSRVSFADALIWTAARSASYQTVYSFDKRFPTDGVKVRMS